MNLAKYPPISTPEDIRKLHSESLQLRNQQFVLATVGMTAVGLSSWFIPKPPGDAAQDAAHAVATLLLVFLLIVLFTWSVVLRRLIGSIRQYLELRGASEWEPLFLTFSRKKGTHWSQSLAVARLYLVLGGVVLGNFFILASSRRTTLWNGYTWMVLGAAAALAIVIAYLTLSRRRYDEQARRNWIAVLDEEFGSVGRQPAPHTATSAPPPNQASG